MILDPLAPWPPAVAPTAPLLEPALTLTINIFFRLSLKYRCDVCRFILKCSFVKVCILIIFNIFFILKK